MDLFLVLKGERWIYPKGERVRGIPMNGAINAETASRYFFYAMLLNIVVAVAITAPVLDPHLGLPIKVNHWPGTWMFVAYFSFLTAGVLGMLTWSVTYYMLPRLLQRNSVSRILLLVHLSTFEVSVVGATGLMGIVPGYIGGSLIQAGLGDVVVTRVIEWTVIPIGILIGTALLSTLAGVLNLLFFSASH